VLTVLALVALRRRGRSRRLGALALGLCAPLWIGGAWLLSTPRQLAPTQSLPMR